MSSCIRETFEDFIRKVLKQSTSTFTLIFYAHSLFQIHFCSKSMTDEKFLCRRLMPTKKQNRVNKFIFGIKMNAISLLIMNCD